MFFPIVWFSVLLIISKSFAREIRLGRTTYNEDDAEIQVEMFNVSSLQEVAEKAMEQVNEQTNYRNLYKLVKVISAQTQVVAGIKYYLTILAAPTTCRKAYLKAFKTIYSAGCCWNESNEMYYRQQQIEKAIQNRSLVSTMAKHIQSHFDMSFTEDNCIRTVIR
ncbi:unnamed protein product [Wuchereria bancrofti]|uniref:Cystatin domain-containing protein n=1 Tax=Wuchereria bancrofti TaxID=6293 RepID=A0A3P7E8D4_WUCBA|nr:unnamed protein product [Wuchereria bancrofti]